MAHPSSSFFVLLLAGLLIATVQGADDGFLLLRGTSPHSLDTISELHVADLISHVVGVAPVRVDADRSGFPKTGLFSAPAANLLVTIDSVTRETLNNAQTNFFNLENDKTVTILKADYPEDSLSTLTTLLTGHNHQEHGIVGNSWAISRVMSVEAYSKNGNCKIAKISDTVASISEGGARIVTVAGTKKMAAAMSVNSELMEMNPQWNNKALYYSKKQGLVQLGDESIVKGIKDIREFGRRNSMTLKTAEGHMLASELYGITLIPQQLALLSRADNVEAPDMINIGISSIKHLTLKYGENSPQVLDAIRLLDETLSSTFEALQQYYNGNMVTEVIALQSSTEEHNFYTQAKQQTFRMVLDEPTTSSTTYTSQDVSAFQTKLWVSVSLIIAVILGVLALVKMDMLEDSLIYRTTDGPRPIPNIS